MKKEKRKKKKLCDIKAQLQQGFQQLSFAIMLVQSIIFYCYGVFNIMQIFYFSDCWGDSGLFIAAHTMYRCSI